MSRYNHDVDIDAMDLSEAPRLSKDAGYSKGALLGGSCLGLFFIAMLIYGSLPELSPEEIIAMDGYAGERPLKHIFNLQDIEAGDQAESELQPGENVADNEVSMQSEAETASTPGTQKVTQKVTLETTPTEPEQVEVAVQPKPAAPQPDPVVQQQPVEQEVAIDSTTAEPTEPEIVETVAMAETEVVQAPVSKTEIDAAVVNNKALFGGDERTVVAAMATTPKIPSSSAAVVISSVVAAEPAPMPIKRNEYKYAELSRTPSIGSVTGNDRSRLLPLRSVLQDYTELKESPSKRSKTKMTFGKGVQVTALEKQGEWVLVGANDGSSVTGYVLDSEIGEAK